MRFRTFWGWLLIFGIAAWLIKSDVVTIPAGVQQTFRTGINKVATSLDDVDFDGMVDLDLNYIEHSGILLDIFILLRTVGIVFKPNGAY